MVKNDREVAVPPFTLPLNLSCLPSPLLLFLPTPSLGPFLFVGSKLMCG